MKRAQLVVALLVAGFVMVLAGGAAQEEDKTIGVGAKPPDGAEVMIDGTRKTLDEKWIYWEGPGFKSSMPIKWKIVEDPVDGGTCLMTDDPAAAGASTGRRTSSRRRRIAIFGCTSSSW